MKNRRVYMRFEKVFDSWRVNFIVFGGNEDLRELTFADDWKVQALAERAGALRDLASKQALANALSHGLGGIELQLTPEQFDLLRFRK
jgi:hypothetical protein